MTIAIRDLDALSSALAKRREALGLTQDELDTAAGLPAGTIAFFETERRSYSGWRRIDLRAVLTALRLRLTLRERRSTDGVAA